MEHIRRPKEVFLPLGYKYDDRPARFGWAPGNYLQHCSCGTKFVGDKRAFMCADCAYAVKETKNILWKTKCTVIGPMQYSDGRPIREFFKAELGKLGIQVFDHYNNPFITNLEESSTHVELKKLLEEEKYDEVAAKRTIRHHDLACIDFSDFIIVYFSPDVVTCGTYEEFFQANSKKRPIFFINTSGKKTTPFWIFWTIPHKYIYNSKEEVLEVIQKIDRGEIEIDSERWRLLKPEYR